MPRVHPGLAFTSVCDVGFAVGLVTHQVPRFGDLVWLAEPVFDEQPDAAVVESIDRWRWPVFFPTGAAIRRKLVTGIGPVPIPTRLARFPRMRGGTPRMGWKECTFVDGVERVLGPATDPALPIVQIVNDTRLKEMLISGWTPEGIW